MSKYGTLCFIFLIITLAGCGATTPFLPGPTAHSVVKPGSKLTLNKAVTILPPEAGVRFQNGQVTAKYNQWHPNCRLEMHNPATTNQVIQPDEFTITQVGFEFQLVYVDKIKLASAGLTFVGGVASATAERMRTIFMLHSQSQPHISRLICQHWENPEDSRHLMLNEIEQTLGDYFTFELKTTP